MDWESHHESTTPSQLKLGGRDVFLRPYDHADGPSMRLAELSDELGSRWRFRGSTPGPEEWNQRNSTNMLAQFLVIERAQSQVIGMVQITGPSFQDGYAELAVAKFGESDQSPLLMFGTAIFLNYVFSCWNFHKLYLNVPAYNFEQIESGVGKFFELEGRLRDHIFAYGRRWDQFILAIYRDTWNERGKIVLEAQQAGGRG